MAHDPMNPFGLPHMGASMNNPGQNPLLASMEMMRQAMSGLGQSAHAATGSMSSALTPEDLERKIGELKVVENWLKLNLSILSGTIQGLEVQLATVRTLRSFVAMGGAPSTSTEGDPSPLEVVLGLKPAPKKTSAQQAPVMPPITPPETQTDAKQAAVVDSQTSGNATTDASTSTSAAAQAWWKMIEGQFAQLAAATTQANSAAQAAAKAATSRVTAAKPSTASASSTKPAAKKSAAKTTTKRPAKTAARRTTQSPSKRTQA